MAINLEAMAKDMDARVNLWRAVMEKPKVPEYRILHDPLGDQLYIASGARCSLFATRKDVDDHTGGEWFQRRAEHIMRQWENIVI